MFFTVVNSLLFEFKLFSTVLHYVGVQFEFSNYVLQWRVNAFTLPVGDGL